MSEFSQDFYNAIIESNSPWIIDAQRLPQAELYKREAYFRVEKQLHEKHGMAVLIKGPRRVGKTEIQKQLMLDLIVKKKTPSKRVLYLSFDDVQILAERPENHVKVVQGILDAWANMLGARTFDAIDSPAYCFFDEVQAVGDWAHLVKNRIERNTHVRIVLSGSAAHSIFDKALKILLGRVIDVRLTTFSFREYLEKDNQVPIEVIRGAREAQGLFEKGLDPATLQSYLKEVTKNCDGDDYRKYITHFLQAGGFPQLWKMTEASEVERAQFVDENYVRKVTLEDLMLLQKIKKPELYERLLRHLFARPGQEYNQNKIASTLGTTTVTLAEAMRLLEQTDLLVFVEKFSNKAAPLKLRNVKIYPIDMMLTYAMTKIVPTLEAETDKGAIAESLVAQVSSRLRGLSTTAFMQSSGVKGAGEIDFYLRADVYDCPIEVKYQPVIRAEDTAMLRRVITEKKLPGGVLINVDRWNASGGVYSIPLWAFMLLA